MPDTPRPSRKRVLEDVTNTPPPLPGPAELPLAAQASRLAATSVQRFTLKSRRGKKGSSSKAASLASPSLKLPPRIAGDFHGPVALCQCSWAPGMSSGRRRLCQQNTEDHQEFVLLEVMHSRYMSESGMRAFFITHKACFQEVDVYFIIQPESETAVGYVALRSSLGLSHQSAQSQAPDRLVTVTQIYVEPDFRRRGMAAAALRVLLAGRDAVAVEALPAAHGEAPAVSSPLHQMMKRMGFQAGDAREEVGTDEEIQQVVYRRLAAISDEAERMGSENMV